MKDKRIQAAVFAIIGGIVGAFPDTAGALLGMVAGGLIGFYYVRRVV